jgi:hypothetical protein
MSLGAIIVAGGDSKRFASKIPKQFNIINAYLYRYHCGRRERRSVIDDTLMKG